MAKGNYRDYLQDDYVKIKKYFYVLRPIFACMWMGLESKIAPINNFIENKLEYFESYTKNVILKEKPNEEYLDKLFYKLLSRSV